MKTPQVDALPGMTPLGLTLPICRHEYVAWSKPGIHRPLCLKCGQVQPPFDTAPMTPGDKS